MTVKEIVEKIDCSIWLMINPRAKKYEDLPKIYDDREIEEIRIEWDEQCIDIWLKENE